MIKEEKTLYSSGDLSKMVGIPVSTLRFYDEEKLFTPEFRDAATNYRYYTEQQVMDALFILEMRRLDVPLHEIKTLMEQKRLGLLKETLEEKMKLIQGEIAKLQYLYEYTEQLRNQVIKGMETIVQSSRPESIQEFKYEIKYFPLRHVVWEKVKGNFYTQAKFTKYHIALEDLCIRNNLKITGPMMAAFSDLNDEHLDKSEYDAEWVIPVAESNSKNPFVKPFGDFWGICTTHIGLYHELREVYTKLLAVIEKENYELAGPPIEEYLINCAHINNAQKYVTTVIFPIKLNSLVINQPATTL